MWLYGPLPLASQPVAGAVLGSNSVLLQQGSFTRSHTVALSGTEVTCSQGTAKADRSRALSAGSGALGTNVLSFVGTVTYVKLSGDDVEVFLDGEEIAAESGTAIADRSIALSGSESATGQGTGTTTLTPTTLVSQLITPAAGNLVYALPGASDVTVNINAGEMEILSFTGNVKTSSPLSGQAIATEHQAFAAVSNTPTDPLLGQSFTAGQSSMFAQQDVEDTFISSGIGSLVYTEVHALSGIESATELGTVTATEDIDIALTGEAFDSEIGDVEDSFEISLTGSEILGEQDNSGFGVPLNVALTGAESATESGTVFLDDDRSYPLVGSESLVEQGTMPSFLNVSVNGETVFTEQYIFEVVVELEGSEVAVEQGRVNSRGRSQDAGHPGHGHGPPAKKKKKKVTVDGQVFEVNEEEMAELLDMAKEVATAKAKEEADAAVAAKSTEKIKLVVPKVTGSEELKDAITDIYMQATIDAEVSRNRQLDEEEALVLLLLN
jgi:hypothetical protein